MKVHDFKFTPQVVLVPLFAILAIWLGYWFQIKFYSDFYEWGVYPRTVWGLRGVLFSPFIHGSMQHLWNNTIPLFLLLMALFYFYNKVSVKVLGIGYVMTGVLTWLIAQDNFHIGASGIIYFLVVFLFFKGIQTKHYQLIALSLTIVMVYGGLVWYIFPDVKEGISWEGHLAGFVSGVVVNFLFPLQEYKPQPKFDWEQPNYNPDLDPFMQHFDEAGNFVPKPKPEEEIKAYFETSIKVVYDYIQHKKEDLPKKE